MKSKENNCFVGANDYEDYLPWLIDFLVEMINL